MPSPRKSFPSLVVSLLFLAGSLGCATLLAPAPDQFNIRKVQLAAPGETSPEGYLLTRDRKGQEVYISPIPAMVFWEEGISEVAIIENFYPPDHLTYNVLIQLEPSQVARFEAVTNSLTSGWLALCRGEEVLVVARVYKEIKGGRFLLGGNGPQEEAKALVRQLGFEPRVIRYLPETIASMRKLNEERQRRFAEAQRVALDESPLWTVLRETPLRAEPSERAPTIDILRPPWFYPQSMGGIQGPPGMAFVHRPGWIALDKGAYQGWTKREDLVPDIVATPNDTLRRNLLGHLIGERCPEEKELTPKEQRTFALYRMSIEREFRRRLKSEEAYKSWYQENIQSVIEGRSCQQLAGLHLFPPRP